MKSTLKIVDSVSEWLGQQMKWLALLLIVFVCAEVVSRYVFNRPTIQLPVMSTMTGAALYALSFAYVLLHKGHVRVDILYSRLPLRGQAIMDIVLTLLFFFPAIGFLTYSSGDWMLYAMQTGEKSMMTYWYPVLWPIRTLVFAGMAVFFFQGVAQFIRDLHFAIRSQPYD
jgi:TRAP-type mannitol/chloroaromatic compound transport system permease small subunit